jgi:predicted exporter
MCLSIHWASRPAPVLESFLDQLLAWVVRRSRLVLASVVVLAVLATAALPHLQVDTDVLHLLPRRGAATQAFNRELEARFWPQFRVAAGVGAFAVLALIALGFRTTNSTLFAMLPTAAGLVLALGMIGFAGIERDLFSVFGVLTFLGIGVDYGIHVVHRWRTLRDPVAVVVRLGPALLAGGTTLAGFGTLCFSAYPPLRSLGIVLVMTVAVALATSLTVLPVLLQGRRP